MKKLAALVLCFILLLSAACAKTTDILDTIANLEWSFSSGAGAWSTDLVILADGSFVGSYHDSDMGDIGDGYPDGTVYFCNFSGHLGTAAQVDEHTWKMRVVSLAVEPEEEKIEDGVRYIPSDSYGISEGDTMLLYSPGTPVSVFTEEMLFWTHLQWEEEMPAELKDWFLCSEKNESGFVGYPRVSSFGSPWEEMTAEQLAETTGVVFGVPEGTENACYMYLRGEKLGEMQFIWEGSDCCARVQPIALGENELYDISGMYYEWETEYPVTVGGCFGSLSRPMQDGDVWVERCLWYDSEAGVMYSLSVTSADVDGLDLVALAEQVYVPAQGEE